MAVSAISPATIPLRFGGAFLFVVVTGYLGAFLLPDEVSAGSIPKFVMLILIGCSHLYLLIRAYYSLRISGFFVFTLVYGLLAYYLMWILGLGEGYGGLPWLVIIYLTLLYGYGLSYNHLDAALSGLLHTRGT
jgi:hypothetical protein